MMTARAHWQWFLGQVLVATVEICMCVTTLPSPLAVECRFVRTRRIYPSARALLLEAAERLSCVSRPARPTGAFPVPAIPRCSAVHARKHDRAEGGRASVR